PPLSDEVAVSLLRLLREKDSQSDELRFRTIDPGDLPAPHAFSESVRTMEKLRSELESATQSRGHIAYPALMNTPRSVLQNLSGKLIDLKAQIHHLMTHETKWLSKAATDILSQQALAWKKVVRITEGNLDIIEQSLAEKPNQEVSGLTLVNRDHAKARAALRNDAEELLLHLESGGNLGFWIFRPKVVKKCKQLI